MVRVESERDDEGHGHAERYSVDAVGRFIPDGRRNRFIVVADTARTASAEAADLFLPI